MQVASKSKIEVELWFDNTGACGRRWGRWCAETRRDPDSVLIKGYGSDKETAIAALARALAPQSRPTSTARFMITEVSRPNRPTIAVRRAPPPRHVRDSGQWPMLSFTLAGATA